MVTLSIVSDLQHYDSQLAEVDKMLEQMYKMLGCTLTTIPGVNVITAVKILSEIGDIKRFPNANKLAQFAGIAPLHLSSSGKGKDFATKQGNRRLQATIYFLAIQMVQVSSKGTPRNPVVRAYYEKRKAEAIAAKTDEPIIAQIMQIKSRMPHRNIPQKYIDDLHTLLYADNYDEDAIHAELAKQKLDKYAAAVFDAMTEKTGLTEGFMPLPARKGRKSRQILKYIK